MTLQEAVEQLEADTRDVADIMRAEGIKGDTLFPDHCPIAMYLKTKTKLPIRVGAFDAINYDTFEKVRLSPRIQEFILQFDRHNFPDLVEEKNEYAF